MSDIIDKKVRVNSWGSFEDTYGYDIILPCGVVITVTPEIAREVVDSLSVLLKEIN